MEDIENGKKYILQKIEESKIHFLFNNFEENILEFNDYLDLLLNYLETMPKGSILYRARGVKVNTYTDLIIKDNKLGKKRINGFLPEKMKGPPIGTSSAGRANKAGSSALYLSNKPEVCCAEIRPIFTEMISVMKFNLSKEIEILNLKHFDTFKTSNPEKKLLERVMLSMVEPKKEQTNEEYKLTQHIAQYFYSKGVGGIKYGTLYTNDKESYNLVLFNENDITWEDKEESDVYRVISNSMKFQNLTDKKVVLVYKCGHEKFDTI